MAKKIIIVDCKSTQEKKTPTQDKAQTVPEKKEEKKDKKPWPRQIRRVILALIIIAIFAIVAKLSEGFLEYLGRYVF